MRNKKLIINADDFGWGHKLTDKIIDCHVNGIVTSTTLMVNMRGAEYAAEKTPDFPELSVGLHLNLTEGKPLSNPEKIGDLLNESGEFPGNHAQSKQLWRGRQYYEQVRIEVRAQLQRFYDFGIIPTHCDSHHGIHKMPVVQSAMIDVFKDFNLTKLRTTLSFHRMRKDAQLYSAIIPWLKQNVKRAPVIASLALSHYRLKRAGFSLPDWKATVSMGLPSGPSPKDQLLATIAAIPSGVSEILVHPGDYDADDNPSEWHLKTWAQDTQTCLDSEVAKFIRDLNIELISYRSL